MAGRSTTYVSTVRQNLQSHQHRPTSTREKQHQLIVKSITNATPAEIKTKLKANINPTEIKVGITGLKALRDGRVIIECEKKEDLEQMKKSIDDKLGQELESSIPKLKNPYVVIYKIPDDITMENAETVFKAQNQL